MTLWTPYVEEVALDLTKAAIKEEDYTQLDKYCEYSQQDVHYPAYIAYPQPIYAPTSQISPVSGGSISSYDSCTRLHDQARYQSRLTCPDLSPPVSPMLDRPLKRSYDMIEVDYLSDDPDFQAFKRDALRVMAEKNGGSLLADNPRMRRSVQSRNEGEDEAYRKQRERNNHAAKQSRNRRKLREIHLALKVSYLRREVANLRAILSTKVCGICNRSCMNS